MWSQGEKKVNGNENSAVANNKKDIKWRPHSNIFTVCPWSPSDVDNTPRLGYDPKLLIFQLAGFLLEQN